MKKIYLSPFIILATTLVNAQTAQDAGNTSNPLFNVLMIIVIVLCIVLLLAVFSLKKVTNALNNEKKNSNHPDAELTTWEKLLSLKPLANEKDIELDHDYDGIKELNNPIPVWFNVLFYGTVVFAFCYLIIYHVMDAAPLQGQEYKNEMAAAKIQKDEYIKKAGNQIDENNVTVITDATKLADAKKTFVEKCAVCHRPDAGGLVGPNLTDEFWIHGGTVKDIFKTIKYGVPAKGMVTWENTLKPNEIQGLASYVLSLQGSNPPSPKEPQGEKMAGGSTAPSDSTQKDTTVKK